MKLKGDAVTFLKQSPVDRIGFSKPAIAILVVVVMFAGRVLPGKNLLDIGRRLFDERPVFINIIEEKAEHNTLVPNIDPGVNILTLHARLPINKHISAPAVTAADFIAKIVSKPGHFVVES